MRTLPILAFAGLSSASDTLAVNVGGATVSMTGSGPLWGVLLILATIGGPLLANYAQTRWHIKAGIDVKPDKAP